MAQENLDLTMAKTDRDLDYPKNAWTKHSLGSLDLDLSELI